MAKGILKYKMVTRRHPQNKDEEPKWDNSNWLVKKLEEKAVQAKLAID